jgi:hypothetical protein
VKWDRHVEKKRVIPFLHETLDVEESDFGQQQVTAKDIQTVSLRQLLHPLLFPRESPALVQFISAFRAVKPNTSRHSPRRPIQL